VLYEFKETIQDSAGAGKYRGGLGARWRIRNISDVPIIYSGQAGRLNFPAKGLLGGGDGRPNRLYLNEELQARGWGRWELKPGDAFTKESPGGGGLHSPLLRDPLKVLEDALEGHVSEKHAREVYGVIIDNGAIRGITQARESLPQTARTETDKSSGPCD
jgi:N-methylhydantoinase B